MKTILSNIKTLGLLLLASLVLSACQPQIQESSKEYDLEAFVKSNEEDFAKTAQRILGPLKQNLMGTLMKELEHSAERAVSACQLEAPGIADRARGENPVVEIGDQLFQVELGRTSHKVRNPDNRPVDWMKDYIATFSELESGAFDPQSDTVIAVAASDKVGYLEPIALGPMCMTCHGDEIDGDLHQLISQKYPEDEATGFSPGDFRGFFWVTFELAK